jgi:hypothetical protein
MDRRKLMDRKKNPFYKHADAEFFLAKRDGAIVGRIGAIVNHNHNTEHRENIGFFGFFECVNDQDVANALFARAKEWLKGRGVTAIGPEVLLCDEFGSSSKDSINRRSFSCPTSFLTTLIEMRASEMKDISILSEWQVLAAKCPACQ